MHMPMVLSTIVYTQPYQYCRIEKEKNENIRDHNPLPQRPNLKKISYQKANLKKDDSDDDDESVFWRGGRQKKKGEYIFYVF